MTRVLMERYALEEVVGAGGAARVYRAVDRNLDRIVAVKLLDDRTARSADPGGRDRFLHEARSAARFQHPNLVTVYDAGEDAGELFLVMEYVEGLTLADLIAERAPLPVDEATSITTQILSGLAAVHAHGTIHRDVKPANVLVGADGRVRLTDFGIAKRLDDIDAAITAFGSLVGTLQYLAPEQATGEPLSPATDVYQVGMVLHEMLTGVRVGATSPAMAATAHAVDPRRVRGDVPDGVAEAVTRATQPDPDRRFGSAQEMISALAPGDTSASTDVPASTTAGAGVAAMVAATHDHTRTMVMPTHGSTAVLPRSGGHGADDPATLVATPIVTPTPGADPARQRRPLLIAGVGVLVVALLGALAFADGGDNGEPLLPGTTTLPATAATIPDSAVVTTPPAPEPTTAPVVDEGPRDKPDSGRGKGKGKGKGNG